MYIHNHSESIHLNDLRFTFLNFWTDGDLTGRDVQGYEITVEAAGNVGDGETPFTFWADGTVSVKAGLNCNTLNICE